MLKVKMLFVAVISLCGVLGSVAQTFPDGKPLVHLSGAGKERVKDEWTFSGTQKWNEKYLAFTKKQTSYLAKDWRKRFVLPVPPANSSDRTQGELEYLKRLIPLRERQRKGIQDEVLTKHFRWGGYTYEQLT